MTEQELPGASAQSQASTQDLTPPTYETHQIEDIAELLRLLRDGAAATRTIEWYRGHSSADYKLLPSLAREPCDVKAEQTLIKRFKQNAYPFLKMPPQDPWGWLFLMQHHEAPTRLLDWSDSPLTALWFAVSKIEDEPTDGCVWALQPIALNVEARLKPRYALDIPLFGQDSELNNYLPDRLDTMQANTPAAGIASRQFSRVVAQMGSFTVTGKEQIALEEVGASCLTKYLIPAAAKPVLRRELAALKVSQLTIFPELSNVAKLAQEGLWQVSA
jgi:hypothetical protein